MKNRAFLFLLVLFFAACSPSSPSPQNGDSIADSLPDTLAGRVNENDSCAVLKRTIASDTSRMQLGRDLAALRLCGLDSFDLLYVVPNLMPGYLLDQESKTSKRPTYGSFLNHLREFRDTDSYKQLHDNVMTLDSLQALPYNPKKLVALKPSFGRLGMTEPEWQAFSAFVRDWEAPKNQKTTWRDAFDAFERAMANVNR
ncbi:MAG: hypothetical protein ACRCYO_12330 [Bacteroidia bacterium]